MWMAKQGSRKSRIIASFAPDMIGETGQNSNIYIYKRCRSYCSFREGHGDSWIEIVLIRL